MGVCGYVWLFIHYACHHSVRGQCLDGRQGSHTAYKLLYYTGHTVQAYFITLNVSAVTGATKSYAILAKHQFVAALDDIVGR